MSFISAICRRKYKDRALLKCRALAEAKEIGHILGKRFGAQKVMLYGNLSQKNKYFDMASDIDLAVEGLGWRYFEAYGYCLRLTRFSLDIRAYEDMPQYLKSKIEREGRLLYEKR